MWLMDFCRYQSECGCLHPNRTFHWDIESMAPSWLVVLQVQAVQLEQLRAELAGSDQAASALAAANAEIADLQR